MSTEAFSSIPPLNRVALVDLVETKSPEESRAFVTLVTQLATEVGGRRVIANETLVPMTIPDKNSTKLDRATRLLVVTEYPTTQACRTALAKRKEWGPELFTQAIRTYAARPWSRVQALVIRTIMKTLNFVGRANVPRIDGSEGAEILERLVRASAIHDELPEIGIEDERWSELALRAGDRPIWMLNFLSFRTTAVYPERKGDVPGGPTTSGAQAYARYGQGLVRPLTRVGGRVAWTTHSVELLPDTHDGDWDQIAIAFYPSPAAMLTMLGDPAYKAAHVHRVAGLARTRLVATQPLAGV
jgi:uncharacterized protein (DUF1330 family)